jgi:hypothetical protein
MKPSTLRKAASNTSQTHKLPIQIQQHAIRILRRGRKWARCARIAGYADAIGQRHARQARRARYVRLAGRKS